MNPFVNIFNKIVNLCLLSSIVFFCGTVHTLVEKTIVVTNSLFSTPLEQFEGLFANMSVCLDKSIWAMHHCVFNYLGLTNFAEILIYFSVLYIIVIYSFSMNSKFVSSNWFFTSIELVVRSMFTFIKTNGTLAQQAYLPFFLTVALSLAVYNFSGLFPFGYTFTAHIVCTLFYSFTVFFGLNFISILRYRENFFNIFLPSGTLFVMMFLMVALEVISYISRPFSMAIRLFANLMAGHSLLKILFAFGFQGANSGKALFIGLTIFGFALISLILTMECAVSGLQIFVFLTLTSLYISDVHNVSH